MLSVRVKWMAAHRSRWLRYLAVAQTDKHMPPFPPFSRRLPKCLRSVMLHLLRVDMSYHSLNTDSSINLIFYPSRLWFSLSKQTGVEGTVVRDYDCHNGVQTFRNARQMCWFLARRMNDCEWLVKGSASMDAAPTMVRKFGDPNP